MPRSGVPLHEMCIFGAFSAVSRNFLPERGAFRANAGRALTLALTLALG